jgi:predicted NACHT family NTPase
MAKDGRLLVLFDGLDEVAAEKRKQIVQKRRNLLEENRRVRAVITCRAVVYEDDFTDLVDLIPSP